LISLVSLYVFKTIAVEDKDKAAPMIIDVFKSKSKINTQITTTKTVVAII